MNRAMADFTGGVGWNIEETAVLNDITQQKAVYVADIQANYTLIDSDSEKWQRGAEGNVILDNEGKPILKVKEDGSVIDFMFRSEYNSYLYESYDKWIQLSNLRLSYITQLKGFKSVWFK